MSSGDDTSVLAGLGDIRHLAPDLPDRAPGAGRLHWPGHSPRGESATGEALIINIIVNIIFYFYDQVKYTKQDLTETREERKQRKYRYLYQVRVGASRNDAFLYFLSRYNID